MIPILFDYSDTSWTSNGRGRLSDCISCTVTEERNGVYECEFKYPITGAHYSEIQEGLVIGVIHDDTKAIEPFDIYARSAEIDGVVTFYAHHISYRLLNIVVNPFTELSVSGVMGALVANSINENPFQFMTDKAVAGVFSLETPRSIRELLCGSQGSILDVYGTGEYEFTRYDVKLWLHRGQDTDVEIRYGKNLIDIDKQTDASGTYNAIAPYWYSPESGLITLPEKIVISDELINTGVEPWTNENNTLITDDNLNQIDFEYATIKVVPIDMSSDFGDVPTVEQLREKAKAKLEGASSWLPVDNIKVDFVALWQTEEYKDVAPLQRVSLCDTVGVYFQQLGVNTKAKVIRTVYNVLLECYDEMELGDPRASFAETISTDIITRMNNDMASKSFLAASLNQATRLLAGGLGGHVIFNRNADGQPQEILVMDTDDITTAVNVIRINKNGIGFSRTGYEGPFATAWTIDGHFVADFIDAGTLSADLLRGGTIQSRDGSTYWDLNADTFVSDDGTRKVTITPGKFNLHYNNGNMATFRGTHWTGEHTGANNEGSTIAVNGDGAYLSFGQSSNNDNYTSSVVINNGLNPRGITDKVIVFSNITFTSRVRSTAHIYTDGAALYACDTGETNPDFITLFKHALSMRFSKADDEAYLNYYNDNYNVDLIHVVLSTNKVYFRFTDNAYFTYDADGDYIFSSKTIQQASDERLKNIKPYNDKYDALLDVLEPIIYTWKDHPDGAEYVGLGARKTAALIDDLGIEKSGFVGIGENDKGEEVYGIDYNELSVMLLHKVKKQQEEIDTLKAQLDAVLTRLERLEGKNADT